MQQLTDKASGIYRRLYVFIQKENCRPDGRELVEFRTTTLNIGERTSVKNLQQHVPITCCKHANLSLSLSP